MFSWQKARPQESKPPYAQVRHVSSLRLCLVHHWPKQVTWLSPKSRSGEATHRSGGRRGVCWVIICPGTVWICTLSNKEKTNNFWLVGFSIPKLAGVCLTFRWFYCLDVKHEKKVRGLRDCFGCSLDNKYIYHLENHPRDLKRQTENWTVVHIPHMHFGKRLRCSVLISLLRDLFISEGNDLAPTLSPISIAYSKLTTMRGLQWPVRV